MKILLLSDLWLPFPGGAERFVVNIANQLVKRGHEITVLTSYAKAKQQTPDIPIIIRDIGVNERHGEGVLILAEEIAMHEPDLILTHHFFAYTFRHELAACGIPCVQIVHNGNRWDYAKLAVFNSQYTMGMSNPVAGDMVIHPPAYDDVVAETHGEYIGMIKPIPHKGIHFVYQLAVEMRDRSFLVLDGEWTDFNVHEDHPNVEFMDPVDDIRSFYSRCKILLMPSESEDAGTIPQEAAMNRMPCVSSNVMGLVETNAGGVVLPLNLPCWKDEITRLLTNVEYYKKITDRQIRYLDTFQWEAKFEELHGRLERLR